MEFILASHDAPRCPPAPKFQCWAVGGHNFFFKPTLRTRSTSTLKLGGAGDPDLQEYIPSPVLSWLRPNLVSCCAASSGFYWRFGLHWAALGCSGLACALDCSGLGRDGATPCGMCSQTQRLNSVNMLRGARVVAPWTLYTLSLIAHCYTHVSHCFWHTSRI